MRPLNSVIGKTARYLGVLLVFFSGMCLATGVSAAPVSGPAPEFTLKGSDGKNIKLSELRGEVVMINFWASWCGPCRQEMPLLDKMYQRYKPMGFTLLGINVEENANDARKLLKDVPVTFPILFDSQQAISRQYRVEGMPSTVIIDRDGKIRFVHKGYQSGFEQTYEQQVKTLLKE